ncbi:MAG: diguanylate cyclase [Deltaproteobacteria bacterium]|nr:diguanylate cyclase [Deltaproteobacteria bacterium]
MLVVDDAGAIVLANAACAAMLGYGAGELRGRSVDLLVPPQTSDHAAKRAGFHAQPRARAMGAGLQLHALHADGTQVPVDIALTPLTIGPRRWVATLLRDLRGRPHGADAVRIQATALRSAANGIVITDRGGTIIWVNPAATTITGYPAEELIGQHTRLLKSGVHEPAFYSALWKTIAAGETFSGTMVNRRKDGTHYHEEQTIAAVFGDGGEITHFIAIKQDVSARRRAEDALALAHAELAARVAEIESLNRQLHEQAIRDPLTSLYNRRFLDDVIGREVARTVRSGAPLTIAALDVDRFKHVNDAHGHAAGDQVLRLLAEVLRTHVRTSDLVCRIGGEEFLVVLPGAPLAIARERAEAWRQVFAASEHRLGDGTAIRCTVSIGIVEHAPGTDIAETFRRADAALYDAKHAGRDRVVAV